MQDSQIANPGVQITVKTLLLFGVATTLSSGQVARPSKQQVPGLMQAAATFVASPFLAHTHKVTSFAMALVVSPARTWQQYRPPDALVRYAQQTPLLSTASDVISI